jgi:hypothetical protein
MELEIAQCTRSSGLCTARENQINDSKIPISSLISHSLSSSLYILFLSQQPALFDFSPVISSSLFFFSPSSLRKKTTRTKSFQRLSAMSESITTRRTESTFNRIPRIKDSPPPTTRSNLDLPPPKLADEIKYVTVIIFTNKVFFFKKK